MFKRLFKTHGHFCASRPWEVIFVMLALSICALSMKFIRKPRKSFANWKEENTPKMESSGSDMIILTIVRCVAIVYIYMQFTKLRCLGSKYLLGAASLLTIFFSYSFSVGVVKFMGGDLTGLGDSVPLFFVMLIDLSKACTLTKFALTSKSQDEMIENISQGIALIGPIFTLDSFVETLVVGVGTLSGIRALRTMCCFGCISVIANYFALMTFYPACLAIVLELTRDKAKFVQLQKFTKNWLIEEGVQKTNPVVQKVKIIMSIGLLLVLVQSRLTSLNNYLYDGKSQLLSLVSNEEILALDIEMSLCSSVSGTNPMDDSFKEPAERLLGQRDSQLLFRIGLDYIITFLLASLLTLKYIFFDTNRSIQFSNMKGDFSEDLNVQFASDRDHSKEIKQIDVCPISSLDNNEETQLSEVPGEKFTKSRFVVGYNSSDEETEFTSDMVDVATQTTEDSNKDNLIVQPIRTNEECFQIYKKVGAVCLSDQEILNLVRNKQIPAYKLESVCEDHTRGVSIRRNFICESLEDKNAFENLPYLNYKYKYVDGACCENVIGYMPVPVGVAGPLMINGKAYTIPMATTEGCLVASTNRGCRALSAGKGVSSFVVNDGMTRAPLIRFSTAERSSEVKKWLEVKDNYDLLADAFDSTSRFARLQKLQINQIAKNLYVRFVAKTGDAMGMNMLSKGAEKALNMLQEDYFPDMEIVSLSGNFCTDKKPCAINWIEGRGKSVVCESIVPSHVIRNVLKTSVASLIDLNINKNLVGSIAAGSIGGFNAHAANIVTAIFIATGQDPAQNISSSNCITIMEPYGEDDLYISCTMPSIEVGTVGGGTVLPPQSACLEMLGIKGACLEEPGNNASRLAQIICSTVMAGELSLMSALAAGHLVKSHLKHNRSILNMAPSNADMSKLQQSPPSVKSMNRRPSFENKTKDKICISNAP